jgi:uncharacterized protein (TIGR02996 family)
VGFSVVEFAPFLAAIHAGELGAAAVFADWLEERGDSRGAQLRRLWRRWLKARGYAAGKARESLRKAWEEVADGNLRDRVRELFPQAPPGLGSGLPL